jgi:hypothetical protein
MKLCRICTAILKPAVLIFGEEYAYLLCVFSVAIDETFCGGYGRSSDKAADASTLNPGGLVNQLSLVVCEVNESFPAKARLASPTGFRGGSFDHQPHGNIRRRSNCR